MPNGIVRGDSYVTCRPCALLYREVATRSLTAGHARHTLICRSPRKFSFARLVKFSTVAGLQAKQPSLEARVLSGILKTSDVPYSSYIPEPRTFLHSVSAVIKEIWLLALLVYMARASAVMRLSIAAGCALLTAVALPPRLWKPQLRRLGLLGLLLFVFTAIGSDGVPPMLQQRHPPTALEGLPGMPRPAQSYRYVILHLWIITITRRSISLGIAAASLTFVAFQSASLCLTCTPAEELAVALRTLLRPLAILRVPVNEIGLTLLLSLRFMSLVFEEVRNLSLGLAARGIDWSGLGPAGGIQVLIRLGGRLFSNLMQRSDNIAQAMCARGFVGAQDHKLYLTSTWPSSTTANVVATISLVLLGVAVKLI
ncbi:TPA: hypothetical protein ACH3X2_006113 [Trebouxia sp. C0005]